MKTTMSVSRVLAVTAAAAAGAAAIPLSSEGRLASRGGYPTQGYPTQEYPTPYSIPFGASDTTARANEIDIKRIGWLYGKPIVGNTSYYPEGALANKSTSYDVSTFNAYETKVNTEATAEAQEAATKVTLLGGINTPDEYYKIYDDLWPKTAPDGPMQGMVSNYTSDLLFSMERLSTSPSSIRRMSPAEELPFAVDNAKSVSGMTLDDLLDDGRLFIIDYLNHKDFPVSPEKYVAACQAYFYISKDTGDFLPLAIKPNNEGSDLVFTPEDDENDWLLAKMMFTLNDFWFIEWYHFAADHCTAEIVYLSAIRTLSEDHPVLASMHRLMRIAWAVRPAGVNLLLFNGGPVDTLYPWTGDVAASYTTELYKDGSASSFQAKYVEKELSNRGLINPSFGPELKSFPYYEDSSKVLTSIRKYFKSLVYSYYVDDEMVASDEELQNWCAEANGPAMAFDFPTEINDRNDLIQVLVHLAFLVSVEHGVLNTNSPVASTASFPLHPAAFYQPLPTEKGTIASRADIMAYLPPLDAAVQQIALLASFNRPEWEDTPKTLKHMFDDSKMLARMTSEVQAAEGVFQEEMQAFSDEVSGRTFDANGLSQGMPFIWNALDPNKASYFLTI